MIKGSTIVTVKRTDAEVKASVFWSPVANSRLTIGKVSDAGKD